ncbi:MAG: tetratricopeptide repeat protein [Verrucomicrobia bacterium]|nr:tetratricopeptide repeat protein [Verrucomicrobiota bacterium]
MEVSSKPDSKGWKCAAARWARGGAIAVLLWACAAPGRAEAPARFDRDPNWVAGQAALRDGFFEVARQKFEAFVDKAFFKNSKARGTLFEAQALFAMGRFEDALALLQDRRSWASRDDVEGGFVFWIARAQYELGRYSDVTQTLYRFEREYRQDANLAQAARLSAHALVKLGDGDGALRAFASFQERYPEAPEVPDNLLDWAALLMERSRDADAEQLLRQIIERYPAHPASHSARLWLGRMLVDRGDFSDAKALLDLLVRPRANDSEPDTRAEAWLALADIATAQTNSVAALEAYERGEKAADDLDLKLDLRIARARLLARMDKADAAISLLEAAVASAPARPGAAEAQMALADILLDRGQFANALEAYQNGLAMMVDPHEQARARMGRAWALWNLGRFAEAATVFEQTAPLLTNAAAREVAMVKTGDSYFSNNQFKLAQDAYQKALVEFPASALTPQVLLQLAESMARNREYEAATKQLDDLRARFPKDPLASRAAMRLAALREDQGEWSAAVALYDELLTNQFPAVIRSEALLRSASASYREGDFQSALDRFERVLKEYPDSSSAEDAFYLRGRALHLLGQTQRAMQVTQQFLDRYPTSSVVPEVRFWMAEQYFNAGAFGRAETNFTELVSAYPVSDWADDALYWAGRAAVAQGEFRRALGLFNDLTRVYTNSPLVPDARFAQGDALSELGEYSGALLAFDDIVRRYPSHPLADRARGRRGDSQFMLGSDRPERYQEAIASYRSLLDNPAVSPALWLQAQFKIGRCYERLGRGSEAFRYYLDTVYGWLSAREQGQFVEPVWFVRAAFAAAALKEGERQWDEAIRIYQRVVESGLPAGADAEKQIQKIQDSRTTQLGEPSAGRITR